MEIEKYKTTQYRKLKVVKSIMQEQLRRHFDMPVVKKKAVIKNPIQYLASYEPEWATLYTKYLDSMDEIIEEFENVQIYKQTMSQLWVIIDEFWFNGSCRDLEPNPHYWESIEDFKHIQSELWNTIFPLINRK